MPSFDGLEALGPDACRSDPSAACRYWHTKVRALRGDCGDLSERELTFAGVYGLPEPERGWHRPDEFRILVHDDDFGELLSAEDSAALHSLMAIESVDVNRERLEFLG